MFLDDLEVTYKGKVYRVRFQVVDIERVNDPELLNSYGPDYVYFLEGIQVVNDDDTLSNGDFLEMTLESQLGDYIQDRCHDYLTRW